MTAIGAGRRPCGSMFMVLYKASYGLWAIPCDPVDEGGTRWKLRCDRTTHISSLYVQDPNAWQEVPWKPGYEMALGIVFVINGEPRNLLQSALLRRREWTITELKDALATVEEKNRRLQISGN